MHLFLSAIPTLGWPHVLLRLALAAGLGGAIGFERELRERQAGLRTHLVACLVDIPAGGSPGRSSRCSNSAARA
ncbi:MAG TPA: MgtC/SapB family protein [Gaiellaceae bacterium]|nr:MgtC/SapB family protein [Gaiellaceae bacterium]